MIFLSKFDPDFLPIAENMMAKGQDISVVLIEDAVYFAIRNSEIADRVNRAMKCGLKLNALARDVERRGLRDHAIEGLRLIDYDQMVDLLLQESDKVINL